MMIAMKQMLHNSILMASQVYIKWTVYCFIKSFTIGSCWIFSCYKCNVASICVNTVNDVANKLIPNLHLKVKFQTDNTSFPLQNKGISTPISAHISAAEVIV